MLYLWFSEASQNLSSFRQLLFSLFHRGTKGKNSKSIVFFFFWIFPLWNNENKSCLYELKFWEASENHKSSICWKFQLSISCGIQKSAKFPLPVAKMIWSFYAQNHQHNWPDMICVNIQEFKNVTTYIHYPSFILRQISAFIFGCVTLHLSYYTI